jgi:hypothetical protein
LFIAASLAWAPSVLFGLRTIVKLAVLFFITVAVGVTIDDEKKLNRLMNAITLSCMLSASIAIFCKIFGLAADPKLTLPGMSAAVFSANMLVGLIVTLNKDYHDKASKAFFVAIYIAVILAADTRITIAAMFVIFSVYGFFKMRGLLKVALPVVSASAFLMLFLLVDKFRERMFIGTRSISLDSAKGLNNAMDHLAGSGRFGAWHYIMEKYFYPNMTIGSGIGTTQNYYYSLHLGIGAIHSEYVRLLAESGLFGTFLFLLSMLFYYLVVRRNMKREKNGKHIYIYIMAICSIFTYLTFMATDNAFDYVNQFGFYIFGLIGAAISFPVLSSDTKDENSIVDKHTCALPNSGI